MELTDGPSRLLIGPTFGPEISMDADELFEEEAIADPYTFFGRLRDRDPVHWNNRYQLWIITGYEQIARLVRDHAQFSSAVIQNDARPPAPPIDSSDLPLFEEVRTFRGAQLVEKDQPEHSRMRSVLREFFTPTAVERWRPFVRAAVGSILDGLDERSRMDVVSDLAAPLPVAVIAAMMGVPGSDYALLRQLADKLLYINRGESYRMRPLVEGVRGMIEYLKPLVDERRRCPGTDFLSVLVQGEASGNFGREEVLANAALLLFAGHETTMNLICNGLLALLQHPEQWELLKSDPRGLMRQTTEECLRYDPPVKSTQRIAKCHVNLGGKSIEPGDRMRWVIAAANRDPSVFVRPDEFEIRRYPNPHLAFGGGIHHCLGAALARIEGQEVLSAVASRLPHLQLESATLSYQPSVQFRSLTHLPVSW